MGSHKLPVGSFVRISSRELQAIIERLQQLGYQTVGPRLEDAAIVYGELESAADLPRGYVDEQDGGNYRVRWSGDYGYFDYVVGPHSLKSYVFPPRETLLESLRVEDRWNMTVPDVPDRPLAVIGPRACDLHALRIQDRVFLDGPYVDPGYLARRKSLFIVAVNCRRAAATCFCHSMQTGPLVGQGFDLALTEVGDGFVVEVGSDRGGDVIAPLSWAPCTINQIEEARQLPLQLEKRMHLRQAGSASPADKRGPRPRTLNTTGIRELLLGNLEHPRWEQVADRCLACANCTMVCPTCFCSSVDDIADLTGERVYRERTWDSCFTAGHSYMNTGTVRKSTLSRYRQWLTHKLATWMDQFGTSGCVGCGRCITWCPVGIDLTEEVAALRGDET